MSDQENNEIFRPLEKLIKRPNPVPYKKFVVPMPIEINEDASCFRAQTSQE